MPLKNRRQELLDLSRRDPQALVEEVLSLEERVAQLEEENKRLKGSLALNSRNSSKPPSSDGPAKPAPRSLRKKSARKPGGQRGHPGRTLQPVEKPDHIIKHRLDRCSCGHCHGVSLRQEPVVEYEKRQVFDLPPRLLEVTEHRAEWKRCPVSGYLVGAPFPEEVQAPVQYGARFKAVLSYLNVDHFIPYKRLRRLSEDIFGQPISEATVVAANESLAKNLEEWEQELKEELKRAPLVHLDESGMRIAGKRNWLHVASTPEVTFYGCDQSRGSEAMDKLGIVPDLRNWVMHDHWKAYFTYEECLHALCNQHHLRELRFLWEQNNEAWAKELSEFLLREKKRCEKHGLPDSKRFKKILKEYRRILSKGRRRHPRKKGRQKQSKAANLLNRLQDFHDCVLAYLRDPNVPFTNNQGEQDIRMIKVQQKISGGFRSLHGARVFTRVRSYISTNRKQKRNVFDSLHQAMLGRPFSPNVCINAP